MKIFISALLLLTLPTLAQAKQINELIIEGATKANANIYKTKILKVIKLKFSLNSIEEAMELLFRTETLSGIEVYEEDLGNDLVNITFKVIPKQIIKKIVFNGSKSYPRSDLLNEFALGEGDSYQEDRVKLGIDNIKKFYNLNGFLSANVSAHFLQSEGGNLTLSIDIEEGPICQVQEISFNSINPKLNQELTNRVSGRIRRPFSQNFINDLQNELSVYLSEEKYYGSTITPSDPIFNNEKSKVSINFSISEPYSFALVFDGNAQFSDYQLIQELKLDPNNKLSTSPVDDLKDRLTKAYKKKGYANVYIKHKEILFEQEFVHRISFSITEGPRVKIKEISFEGQFSRKPDYYSDFIFDHSGDLMSNKYYNSDDFDDGIKNLITELQNQGFIAAQIPSTRIDFNKSRENVSVKVILNEGPQTFIDMLIFKGAHSISNYELQNTIGLRAGGPLQLSSLADAANKIADLYRSRGFLDVIVENNAKNMISYFDDNKKANITFDIREGPLVTVSSIVVEGNDFTKDFVILRELQFHTGEVLTPEKINYSELRLQRLALFNSIEIRTLTDDPRLGPRTVLIVVSERNPGIFKSGLGADNELTGTLKGYVGAAYRNLFGTGRSVNARVSFSDKVKYTFFEKEITFGYVEPFIFGTNNNLRATATQSTKLYSITPDSTSPHGEQVLANDSFQSDLVLERDLTRDLKFLFELYGIAHINKYEIYGQADPQPLDIATVGPSLIFDNRDNALNPKRGIYTGISVEYSSPNLQSSRTVNYVKTVANFSKYFAFGPFVFAQELKAGHIRNLSTDPSGAIPQIKAFILGGRSTIRGFDPSESIPRTDYEIPNGITTAYNIFYLAKSELRFPISGNFGGALFYDGGHVEYPGFTQQFPWRDAAGVGLRYITPVGPVSLEYGLKLNRDQRRSEAPAAWHFSIGVF